MSVCIAGMHRSGTSMVTHVLHECGLDLGASTEMMAPSPDNPRGYWEHNGFVGVNRDVLVQVGGDWDRPPTVPAARWPALEALAPLRQRACSLVAGFQGSPHWGWKDPRNSFTLPFWQDVVPDLKVVVCLRHPLEVQRSLQKRRHSPHRAGLDLWHIHNRFILEYTTPAQRLVTHYEAYFERPEDEVRRVLRFLGMSSDRTSIDGSLSVIAAGLRHHDHAASAADSALRRMFRSRRTLPQEVSALYLSLCQEAQWA